MFIILAWRAIFLSFSWAFFYSLSSKPYTFLCISTFVVKKLKFHINFPMSNTHVRLWFKKKNSLWRTRTYKKQQHFKCRAVEPSPEWYIYKTPPHLRLGQHWGGGDKKMVRARWGSCYETVSPSSIRRHTHKVSSICLPKYELNKNNTKGYVKADNSKPEPYMNNYGQLKNAENRRNSLAQGGAPQFVIQWVSNGLSWKIYLRVTLYRLRKNVITTNEKISHESERE